MRVEVTTPEDYMGDVIGDINSRRGRIEGMDDIGGGKMIRGFVPLAEMFGYATDLRSRTQGRGNYSMFFEKYEPVPKSVQEKVLSVKTGKIIIKNLQISLICNIIKDSRLNILIFQPPRYEATKK